MKSEQAASESVDDVTIETPPLYRSTQSGSSSLQPVCRALPDIKPTNFVYLSRENDTLRGSWIIDPAMFIPSTFLPPLTNEETEETRSNICFEVTRNGAIHAKVFLLPTRKESTSPTTQRQRVYIRGTSRSGNVIMKIAEPGPSAQHEVSSEREDGTRWPMEISCLSAYGSVNIYLPRSFQGPIDVQVKNGSVRFSDAMQTLVTQFSDINGMQKSFLGDFDAKAIQSAGEWIGDTLSAEATNGTVRLFFDDEDIPPPAPKIESKGFLERWFGS